MAISGLALAPSVPLRSSDECDAPFLVLPVRRSEDWRLWTTAIATQPLRYFIHDDFDALRMEIAGSLVGSGAQRAYEAWRVAHVLARRARLIVDISYVTQADEYGGAVLEAWQKEEVQIVAASPRSLAIANSIPRVPAYWPSTRRRFAGRLAFLFEPPAAGNLPNAGRVRDFFGTVATEEH